MKGESYKNMSAYFSETKARNTTIKALNNNAERPVVVNCVFPVFLVAGTDYRTERSCHHTADHRPSKS